eukprot:CAMPEP_0174365924 /NCGR_PEP_ID=MMETSP0811_2-20130205/79105_1 /TAXON_ID=73025 ORGANISM="Eutreptiella gymnastica-like, Strain CCMP1594" /NCGR_SAMPLE_ID=MMETSP0811_2 /ASSEMBLY_ACC=CAM_ASM_000667 /LENGTH=104 /DNA_ID=CAMNT_0015506991 /DNA_START=530 /DNA_END=845 /DNA_ORIENTATION=-
MAQASQWQQCTLGDDGGLVSGRRMLFGDGEGLATRSSTCFSNGAVWAIHKERTPGCHRGARRSPQRGRGAGAGEIRTRHHRQPEPAVPKPRKVKWAARGGGSGR